MTTRKLTVTEYTMAFETWQRVNTNTREASRIAGCSDLIAGGIAAVRAAFPDGELRAPDAYCAVFESFLGERDATPEDAERVRSLRLAIRKSCLLDRLIYIGEPLRTVPCPRHHGRWSGLSWPGETCTHGPGCRCPHGCACVAPCGCATGWVHARTVQPAVCGAVNVDGDGREVSP